jgi:hypothetical protein
MSLVVVDGDLISYKASAASETRTILVKNIDNDREVEFANRTAFKAWLKDADKNIKDYLITDIQTPEPLENCLHTVKMMLQGIHEKSGCDEMKVVVQGEGNFRDNLLLPTKYKSNRVDTQRPLHLAEARDYLIGKYKAEKANGRESDDVLAAYAYEGFTTKKRIVQATIDKDANQCMGWLYNWDKMQEPMYISGLGGFNKEGKGYGRKFLYYQICVGDPSDCYKPTELVSAKYGAASAFKDFDQLTTDKECWEKMKELYQGWYPEEFMYTAWNGEEVKGSWLQMMQLYTDCAHMRRFETDRLDVEQTLSKMGIDLV